MNKQSIINYIDQKYQKKAPAEFRVGDTLRISVRITEGDNSRIQMFEGIVIAFGGLGGGRTFTIRKISFGVGVERCFPLYSPNLEKIEILRSGHTRRAKLYYLRDRVGRSAKLEEKESVGSDSKKAPEQKAAPAVVAEEVLVSAEKK